MVLMINLFLLRTLSVWQLDSQSLPSFDIITRFGVL